MEQWLKEAAQEISIDSLPESLQSVALIIGLEATLQLSEHFGGMRLYFCKPGSILREWRDDRIRREFNGFNHGELARKYNLTETWIRDIVQRKRFKQTELFEE